MCRILTTADSVWYTELPKDSTFTSLLIDLSAKDIDELDAAAQQRIELTSTAIYKRVDKVVTENLIKLGGSFFIKLNSGPFLASGFIYSFNCVASIL